MPCHRHGAGTSIVFRRRHLQRIIDRLVRGRTGPGRAEPSRSGRWFRWLLLAGACRSCRSNEQAPIEGQMSASI